MSTELTDLLYVGPATAPILEGAGIDATDLIERRVSHAQLVEAGVNPGVAAKIRREHSLSWSLSGGEDLDRRAEQVRGLKDGEREWVAASASDWEGTEKPDSADTATEEAEWSRRPWPTEPDPDADFDAEAEWRERSAPTPLSTLSGLGAEEREQLAEAGITSVRRLATCDPEEVAASLDIETETVREWHTEARAANADPE